MKGVYSKDTFNEILQKCIFKRHFQCKSVSSKHTLKFFESVSSKNTFSVKLSKLLKVSLENTLLKCIFPKDTFHVEKITLNLGIFLNLYYLMNFLVFLH